MVEAPLLNLREKTLTKEAPTLSNTKLTSETDSTERRHNTSTRRTFFYFTVYRVT
jgi:hypothetical protein